jgi:lipopolysaccharide transport system ATP-binding protein
MTSSLVVEDVSKEYRLGRNIARYGRLTESLASAFRRKGRDPDDPVTKLWALRDVSFAAEQGEVLGLIGGNGAGKSTMLKVLARITTPTVGYSEVRGRVGSLLEVGTGFHPELTGRENVFLSGAILGMGRAEIRQRFDAIVEFSELSRFMDTPVKRFSSGMYMRLAFAVAAHLEPEVLLVDEVLAVGDAAFQKKCLGKMDDVAREGRTIVFVSHNLGAIRSLCSRVLWINGGRLAADGKPEAVIQKYVESTRDHGFAVVDAEGAEFTITGIDIASGDGTSGEMRPGDDLRIALRYRATKRIERPQFWVVVSSKTGGILAGNMLIDGASVPVMEGEGTLTCHFEKLPLLPQTYTVAFGGRRRDNTVLFMTQDVGLFHVVGTVADYGMAGPLADQVGYDMVPVMGAYRWVMPTGEEVRVPGLFHPAPVAGRDDRAGG